MGIFVIANVILPQSPNFKGLSLPRECSTHCEGCTQGRPLFTKFLPWVAVNISISYNWDSFLNEKMRIIFETKKRGCMGALWVLPNNLYSLPYSLGHLFYVVPLLHSRSLQMIICRRLDPPEDHLQEAGSSGGSFARGQSKWSIASGRIVWMIVCKRPDP